MQNRVDFCNKIRLVRSNFLERQRRKKARIGWKSGTVCLGEHLPQRRHSRLDRGPKFFNATAASTAG